MDFHEKKSSLSGMKLNIGFLTGVFLLAAWFPTGLQAEIQPDLKSVTVIGTTRAQGVNPVEARENAIRYALINAVDSVVLEMFSGDTLAADFSQWNENLVARPQQFVQGYRVLAETRTADFHRVMVQVGVSVSLVRKQIFGGGGPTASPQQPSLLLMIAIQVPESAAPVFWWGDVAAGPIGLEEAMSGAMTEKGFSVVSHGNASDPVFAPVRRSVEPDISGLKEVGSSLNADYIVIGRAVGQKVRSDPGVFQAKGMVKFRVIRTDSGEEIGSVVQTAGATHTEETGGWDLLLRSLGLQAGHEAVQLLQRESAKPWRNASIIDVTVQGSGNFKQYAAFRKTLTSTPGVKNMVVKEMKPDEAVLAIEFAGNSRQLVDAVMAKHFTGYSVEIGGITDTGVVFVILAP
jgi:hypothetical protein